MKDFTQLYADIEDLLVLGWDEGRSRNGATYSLKYKPLSTALSQQRGKAISLKLWIDSERPHRIDFEIIDTHNVRGDLAESLREYLIDGRQPATVHKCRGTTKIAHVKLDGSDTQQTEQVRAFIEYLSRKLSSYQSHSKVSVGTSSALDTSISRMIANAKGAANQSGSESVTVHKHKEVRFESDELFEDYLEQLHEAQAGLCALSDLPLLRDGMEGHKEHSMSLDRIDSNGHYEAGNLQIVCRFINRWKSDSDNEEFNQLLEAVRTAPPATRGSITSKSDI